MDNRYKHKAYIGLITWLLTPFGTWLLGTIFVSFITPDHPSKGLRETIILVSILVTPTIAFFWGGSYLAKAKGYSNAILMPGILGIFVQLIILALLLFALPDRLKTSFQPGRHRHRHQDESPIAKIVRHRKNAFVYNLFGMIGIILAVMLVILPIPLTETVDAKRLIALGIFVPSYAAVILGCSYWTKAKNWHDGVVLIGLSPLAVFFIPFVRLLYRFDPVLLPVGMVFMPILMIGVIAVLPDKSGMPKRKRWYK